MLIIQRNVGKLSSFRTDLNSCLGEIQLLLRICSAAHQKDAVGVLLVFGAEGLNAFQQSFFHCLADCVFGRDFVDSREFREEEVHRGH